MPNVHFSNCLILFPVSCEQFPVDLVTFTEEILNGKLHFLCSVCLIYGDDSLLKQFS